MFKHCSNNLQCNRFVYFVCCRADAKNKPSALDKAKSAAQRAQGFCFLYNSMNILFVCLFVCCLLFICLSVSIVAHDALRVIAQLVAKNKQTKALQSQRRILARRRRRCWATSRTALCSAPSAPARLKCYCLLLFIFVVHTVIARSCILYRRIAACIAA